jgi:hypothetical protein
MELLLTRLKDNGISTIGTLGDEKHFIYTIEDTYRENKIWGKTCIPLGTYEIKLRTEGLKHEEYKKKFSFHRGMLWLQDVPNFEYVLIHIGNTAEDTNGCILVGSNVVNDNFISGSSIAYVRLYFHVMRAFDSGEKVYIKIINNE